MVSNEKEDASLFAPYASADNGVVGSQPMLKVHPSHIKV